MLADNYTFVYDGANRMTSAAGPGPTRTYGYDGLGNRVSVTKNSLTENFVFDGAGMPVSSDEETPSNSSDDTQYLVDEHGNLTRLNRASGSTEPDWTFSYDSWAQMTNAQGASTIDYKIDPLNRVIQRTEGSVVRNYLYRGMSEDPTSITEGSSTTTFAYGPGGPLASQAGGSRSTYLRDLHGDVVGTINGSGTMVGTRTVRPFGEERATTGTTPSPFGFQSDMTDEDTGLVDMLTRYYLPELGRFTTRDVIFGDLSDPMSLNQFGYASGNPSSLSDPLGLMGCPPDSHAKNCVQHTEGKKAGEPLGPPGTSAPGTGTQSPGVSDPQPSIPRPTIGIVWGVGSDRRIDPSGLQLVESLTSKGFDVRIYPWCSRGWFHCATDDDLDPSIIAARLHTWARTNRVGVLLGHSKGGVIVMEMMTQIAEGRLDPLPLLTRSISINSPLQQSTIADTVGNGANDRLRMNWFLPRLSHRQETTLYSVWNTNDITGSPAPSGVVDLRYSAGGPWGWLTGRFLGAGSMHSHTITEQCATTAVAQLAASGSWTSPSC